MPPPLLIDLDAVNLDSVLLTREQIYDQVLPHRGEFMLLDGICAVDRDRRSAVAYTDVGPDAWWVKGHVPGRPLLPGVLMLELAAQTAAAGASLIHEHEGFIGFGGVDGCKFRDTVEPTCRMYLLCVEREYRPRRIVSTTQGVVNSKIVFEAQITGVTLK